MADINVVIKISEEDYATIMSDKTHQPRSLTNLEWKIANGIPLPKGHGDLIDKKVAYKKFYVRCLAGVASEVFAETPTIIKADRQDEQNREDCLAKW